MKRNKCGFTIVELTLVIALSGIIFLTLAQAVIITLRSWDIVLSGTELIGQTEVSFDRMARDIRRTAATSPSLIIAASNDIKFTDVWGSSIEYKLSGGKLMRNQATAIDRVGSLLFEYFDKNGVLLASPIVFPSYTNVRAVRMTMTTTAGSQTMTVRTLAKFRNYN